MSAKTTTTVTCDAEDCDARCTFDSMRAGEARALAMQRYRWVCGVRDYCPFHGWLDSGET